MNSTDCLLAAPAAAGTGNALADLAREADVGIDVAQVEGVPHSQLFRQFCRALGITDGEPETVRPAVSVWRGKFLPGLQHGTPAFCVGALGLGTEGVVRASGLAQLRAGMRFALDPRAGFWSKVHAAAMREEVAA